jgi:hypothetical protein
MKTNPRPDRLVMSKPLKILMPRHSKVSLQDISEVCEKYLPIEYNYRYSMQAMKGTRSSVSPFGGNVSLI